MPPWSVALVLLSAAAHVYWNLHVKRSPAPAVSLCLLIALGSLLFLPLGLYRAWPVRIPQAGWLCVAGTGLVYVAYYQLIALSYRRDDLSRAYPIARGVAPAATALWGLLFLGEHPSPAGWTGIAAVSAGVILLGWPGGGKSGFHASGVALLAAIGTGLCTSGYSAIDKQGVRYIEPSLYVVLTSLAGAVGQAALLIATEGVAPFVGEMRRDLRGLLWSGFIAVGSYLVVLFVLRSGAPVGYVVPLRSVAVLLSVVAGAHFLGERGGKLRLAAAVMILSGLTLIAWKG